MKQDLSQIHIWEAFENENSECPICEIERKAKTRLIESFFTERVMDYKFQVSIGVENYLCREHFQDLYAYNDKLGLAIVVDRLLDYEKKKIYSSEENPPSAEGNKNFKSFFKKKKLTTTYQRHDCYICSNLKNNVHNSMEILIEVWRKNEDFRSLYASARGFCMKHFHDLMDLSSVAIKDQGKADKFKEITTELQHNNIKRLQEELQWFIQKFDYRYDDKPWGTSKDSLVRSILKVTGNFK